MSAALSAYVWYRQSTQEHQQRKTTALSLGSETINIILDLKHELSQLNLDDQIAMTEQDVDTCQHIIQRLKTETCSNAYIEESIRNLEALKHDNLAYLRQVRNQISKKTN